MHDETLRPEGYYPAKDRAVHAWRNGRGKACEILRQDVADSPDDYLWRLSTAEVEKDGDFSVFPDMQRILKVVEGGPLHLDIEHQSVELRRSSPAFHFMGDLPCYARLSGPKVVNLNLLLKAGLHATLEQSIFYTASCNARFAFLLEDFAAFTRFDLFDLTKITRPLRDRLQGAKVVLIDICI